MAYDFEVEKKDDYVLITASGALDSMMDMIILDQSLNEVAVECDCRRLLIDERACVKTLNPHDLIVFSEFKMGEPRLWKRMAVIYSPEGLSKLGWIETILQNRSVAYRQFSSFDEAEQWLLS